MILKKLSAVFFVSMLIFGASLAHADVKTAYTSIKLTISSTPSPSYDEAYTFSIPANLTVEHSGWNSIGNITIAHDQSATGTTFDPAKKVVITATSDNSFALKSGENSISYTLKTAEADTSATTVFEFTAAQINEGASQAIGISVENYSSKPEGEYTDKITYTAQVIEASYIVGGKVTFGTYSNHELSWTVMSVSDTQALLLCDNAVAKMAWDSASGTTWESSSLYNWLNGDFKNNSFEASDVRTAKISGVTLLSKSEVTSLPFTNTSRVCKMLGGGTDTAWWLNTLGTDDKCAVYVGYTGSMNESGSSVSESVGVRPALWLNLQ